jgi:hypothetical protein
MCFDSILRIPLSVSCKAGLKVTNSQSFICLKDFISLTFSKDSFAGIWWAFLKIQYFEYVIPFFPGLQG